MAGRGRGASGGGGGRSLHVRVKSAKGRRRSSTRWLERQLNDPYVQQAKRDGLRGRAAYKIAEIDDRFAFLAPGARVVDLGCAPGGWLQIAVERANALGERSDKRRGHVIGADVKPVEPVAGADVLELDFLEDGADDAVAAALGGPADVVMSDMAAPATGHKATDHLKIMALAEAAADFADRVLAPGGTFVAKVLQGGTEGELLARLKRRFAKVQHVKPPASRADSAETYVVATGFRGDRRAGPEEA